MIQATVDRSRVNQNESGKVTMRVKKQYNNNTFPNMGMRG